MRNYLKALRQKFDYTQEQVAEKLGIKANYYNMIENGNRRNKMDIDTALKLSNVFNVPVNYILEEEQKLQSAS